MAPHSLCNLVSAEACAAETPAAALQGLPPPEGYNEEWLAGFVERLSAFDRDMNTVVQNSRILAGVPPPALAAAGAAAAQLQTARMMQQLLDSWGRRCSGMK